MSGGFNGVVVIDHLPEFIKEFREEVSKICADSADEITMVYGATAPRLTGFMRSSAYTLTNKTSSYGQNLVGDGPMLPEMPKPNSDLEAIAAVAADYAAYPEFGTRYMHAQPAFIPAVDKVRPRFEARFSYLESKLKHLEVKS